MNKFMKSKCERMAFYWYLMVSDGPTIEFTLHANVFVEITASFNKHFVWENMLQYSAIGVCNT